MTEFLVLALTIAIVFLPLRGVRGRPIVASILVVCWLSVLAVAIRDLPKTGQWSDLIKWSPVTALFVAPFILAARGAIKK